LAAAFACPSTGASAATVDPQDALVQPAAVAAPAGRQDRAVVIAPRGIKTNLLITPVSLVIVGLDTHR